MHGTDDRLQGAEGLTPDQAAAVDAFRAYVSAYSEEHWASGWVRGIEHDLWEMLRDPAWPPRLGDRERATLDWLARQMGGWCGLDAYYPAPVWEAIHAAWLREREARRRRYEAREAARFPAGPA